MAFDPSQFGAIPVASGPAPTGGTSGGPATTAAPSFNAAQFGAIPVPGQTKTPVAPAADDTSDTTKPFFNNDILPGKILNGLTASTQALGKTLGNDLALPGNVKAYQTAVQSHIDQQNQLLDQYKAAHDAGQDTSKIGALLHQSLISAPKSTDFISQEQQDEANKGTGAIAGEVLGTAADALGGASIGGEASAAENGLKLVKDIPSVVAPVADVARGSKIIPVLKDVAKATAVGAGTGYVSDVAQGLQANRGANRTGAKALIPGAGTVLGAVLPAVATGAAGAIKLGTEGAKLGTTAIKDVAQSGKPENIIAKRTAVLGQIENNSSPVRRVIAAATAKGIDVKDLLARTDLLHEAVDNTGTLNTRPAIAELTDFIKPQEDVISKNLAQEGKTIPLKNVEDRLTSAVNASPIKGSAKLTALQGVKREVAGLKLEVDKNGNIPLSAVHDAKVSKYANINYLNPESKTSDKLIARTLKEIVENKTSSVNVKNLNAELARHYTVLNLLEKLDGKKVAGSKLGKYFAKTIGAVAGSHFGPLGTIAGSEIAGRVQGAAMAGSFGRKLGVKLESSPEMQAAIARGKK